MEGEDPLDRQEGGTQSKVACGVHTEGHTEVSVRAGGGARVLLTEDWYFYLCMEN